MTDPDHHAMMEENYSYGRHIQDLEIEVEWLRALKEGQSREIAELRTEVERLNKVLYEAMTDGFEVETLPIVKELRAEVERLLAALKIAREYMPDDIWDEKTALDLDAVDRALEGK